MALQVLRPPDTLPVDPEQVAKDIEVLHAAGVAQAGTDEVRLFVFGLFFGYFWRVFVCSTVFGLLCAYIPPPQTPSPPRLYAASIFTLSYHSINMICNRNSIVR